MKDPWFAVLLSYFLPGLGHLYAGRPVRGAVFLVPYAACLLGVSYFIFADGVEPKMGFVAGALAVLIWLAALVDSHGTTRRAGAHTLPEGTKDPWLAGFLSYVFPGFFLPGVGQIYGKRAVAGVIFMVLGVTLGLTSYVGASALKTLSPALLGVVRFAALWHAQWALGSPRKALSSKFLILVPLILAEALVAACLFVWVPQNVVTPVPLAGSAMAPALRNGDLVLLDRRAYLNEDPGRDDIVIYQETEQHSKVIARIVALPGEEVQVAKGKLQVKGVPVGRLTREVPEGEWGSLNLPEDHYLIIMDNASLDPESGYPSPVKRQAILGRVYKRVFPLGGPSSIDASPGATREKRHPDPSRSPDVPGAGD